MPKKFQSFSIEKERSSKPVNREGHKKKSNVAGVVTSVKKDDSINCIRLDHATLKLYDEAGIDGDTRLKEFVVNRYIIICLSELLSFLNGLHGQTNNFAKLNLRWHGGQAVRRRSRKPKIVGSNPSRAYLAIFFINMFFRFALTEDTEGKEHHPVLVQRVHKIIY